MGIIVKQGYLTDGRENRFVSMYPDHSSDRNAVIYGLFITSACSVEAVPLCE
jgi:hypothetical protein